MLLTESIEDRSGGFFWHLLKKVQKGKNEKSKNKTKAGVLCSCGVKFTQLEISKFKEWKLICQCQARHVAQHKK